MRVNSAWFRNRITSQGLSQRKLAAKLKIDPSALTLFLQNKRRLQLDEAATLASLLSVSLDEVLTNAGLDTTTQSSTSKSLENKGVPITGYVDGDLVVHWGRVKGPQRALWPVQAGERGNQGAPVEAVRFETAGTPFDGMDGTLAYFAMKRAKDGGLFDISCVGRLSIVEEVKRGAGSGGTGGRTLLRVVKRGYDTGTYKLALMNGEVVDENVKLAAGAPIIWMKF